MTPAPATEQPPGTHGEVCVRADTVMRGYWDNRAATAEALANGWLRTGDIGVQSDFNVGTPLLCILWPARFATHCHVHVFVDQTQVDHLGMTMQEFWTERDT